MPKKRLKAIAGLAAPVAVIDDQSTTGGGAQTLGDGFNQRRWQLGERLWNLVRGFVTLLTAKVALMLQNQAWGSST